MTWTEENQDNPTSHHGRKRISSHIAYGFIKDQVRIFPKKDYK